MTGDDDHHRGINDRTDVVPYDQATRRPGGASPRRLGRYILERIIAQGGMAEIWLATVDGPGGFKKKVVVKRIRPGLVKLALRQQQHEGTAHNRTVEMFVREARLLARLEHANIVQVFELGVQPAKRDGEVGEHFIVMEYLEGLTLKDLALRVWESKQALPIDAIVRIVADVCLGLDHAHRLKDERGQPANLVHRDISPDNIFVTSAGATKLLDFGIAKREDWSNLTQAGELKGKVPYMAPEQLKGLRVDGRTDLFALGTVLYWLLVGRRPFDGPSDVFTMQAIVNEAPPRLRERNAGIPQQLEDIVLRCLHKEPQQRYSSAAALHDALSMLLLGVHGKQTSVAELVSSTTDLSTPTFEVVPDLAATLPAGWGQAPVRAALPAPVPISGTFDDMRPTIQAMSSPAPHAPVSVAAARTRTMLVANEDDAATLMQVDPADLPSTIPPTAIGPDLDPSPRMLSAPSPPSTPSLAEAPTRETARPSWPHQAPELDDSVDLALNGPRASDRHMLSVPSTPSMAEAPTRETARPSWPHQAPELDDSVEVGLDGRGEGDWPRPLPGAITAPMPISPPPLAAAPRPTPSRSRLGTVLAALTGAAITAVLLGSGAWMLGLLPPPAGTLLVDAGTDVVAPTTPVTVAPVIIVNVDAGIPTAAAVQVADAIVDDGVDDGIGDNVGAAVIVDAGPSLPHRRRSSRVKTSTATDDGFLVVRARPWARISVDGVGIGTTPMPAVALSAGTHRLMLEHDGTKKRQTIAITSRQTTTIQVDMRVP